MPQVFIIQLICAIIIFIYGKYRCDNPDYEDILLNKFNIGDLDGWSATHFLFFSILGYYYPDQIKMAMFGGIMWELFEAYYGHYKPTFLMGFGHCAITDAKSPEGLWWYGKISDLIMNYGGFIIGRYLRTKKLTFGTYDTFNN